MSVPQSGCFEKPKQMRQRFHPPEETGQGGIPNLATWQEQFKLLLPVRILQELARRCGALDVRQRKLPCVVFFWAVVLALSAQEPVWLSTVASQVGVACIMAGLDVGWSGVSKQAVSENMSRRPWVFFAAVFKYLLTGYAARVAGPVAGLEVLQQLDVLVVDTTVIRVAQRLAATFPTYPTAKSCAWAAVQVHTRLAVLSGLPEVLDLTGVKDDELAVSFLQAAGAAVLYIFDLGYWCYALFDEIMNRQQHFISRLKGASNPVIKEVHCGEQSWIGKRLKEIEPTGEEVELTVNLTCAKATAKERRKSPRTLAERRKIKGHKVTTYMEHDVRLVGRWDAVHQQWFFYITSLTDSQAYPVSLICDLYRLRWQIEIFFRNLKHVLGVNHFVSQSENGIRIQLYAAMIYYLLTRLVVRQAAAEIGCAEEDFSIPYCLHIVRTVLSQANPLWLMSATSADYDRLERLLISAVIAQGLRPNRHRPALLTSVKQRLPKAQVA
jgi:hypothetical protein